MKLKEKYNDIIRDEIMKKLEYISLVEILDEYKFKFIDDDKITDISKYDDRQLDIVESGLDVYFSSGIIPIKRIDIIKK